MHLKVGNSDSAEGSAPSCWISALRRFGGYDVKGWVCGGVNTGAAPDLWGNTAPAR